MNNDNETHDFNPYDFTFPTLDDETVVEISEFLYELVGAFEFLYSPQIRRYYRSLWDNSIPEKCIKSSTGENDCDENQGESEWLNDEIDF